MGSVADFWSSVAMLISQDDDVADADERWEMRFVLHQ